MIKLTQGQASQLLNSPVSQTLFNSDEKLFPISDSLKIADFIEQIKTRQKPYLEAMRKIIKKYGGTAHESGGISYETAEDRDRANQEMAEINIAEIELSGDYLEVKDSWPKLTLAEASIINPLIKK